MTLRTLHGLCREIPTWPLGNGAWAMRWLDGRVWVNYTDEHGMQCGATLEDYEQRMAGLRMVRFMAADGTCLKETTMNGLLKLTGQVQ